ncbi:biotin/lipoyl-containing protein [[Clostridium] symbiosum]|uniref:biotin/lipoyl-containing protein n=1 Tax=Clostridium symbiosum TaxID=1512 RepID=UPI001D074D28|nr:biotin/lipoyl-containing protein [[Clostridium] symbiosum]MCB6608858.1 acetyl-CoA carboxylase biotin carboxyl carrier protein subunit [[Clostridium] symbiosum]MCB6929540.1 acetyl-CoA carboxylase biotin carboxyl carrier protein subunit [[Clostridium] symbiosum]
MKYTATLNGKQYEVELERVGEYEPIPRYGEAAPAPAAPIAAPAAAPAPAAAAPAPAPAPVAAPAPAAAPAAGGTTVEAPMPGKVLDIKVAAGQAVKYGQVVMTMEAMKMETEIVAPADGTVSQILVKAGDAVETGTAMVVLN